MAVILLLRSSCISPIGIDDGSRNLLTTTATAGSQQAHGAASHGRQALMPSSHSTISASVHARAGTPNKKNDRLEDFDYIASHPIQCDVSLIPRLQPITANGGATGQQQKQRGRSITMRHFPKQSFLPCGMNNVISIDQFLPASAHEHERDRDIDMPYLLSLNHCVVHIEREIDANPTLSTSDASLPVLASPSTFQFSFRYANNNRHSDHPSDARLGLSRAAVGEIQVSFDYSIALEYYNEITRPSYQDYAQGATFGNSRNSVDNNSTFSSSSKTSSQIDDSAMNEAVASLQRSIMKETLFLTKALIVLGCMGIFFIVTLVLAFRRIISEKGKRLKRRRTKRLVVSDDIPREIGVLNQSSTKHSSPGSDQASPFSSPPPTSTVGKIDDFTPMQSSGAMAHLISPSTPPAQVKKSSINMQCGEESSSKSLRQRYDDYLSPKRHVRSESDMTPRSTSAARKTTRDIVRANEEVIGLWLSSHAESNSAVDEVSLGNSGGKASQSTNISSLSDALENGNPTSRQCLIDSDVVNGQPKVTPSSSPTSTCRSSGDVRSQSSSVDVSKENGFSPSAATICTHEKTVCDADSETNAIAPGKKLVHDKSLNCLPKMTVEGDRSPFWFAAELTERATGTDVPDLETRQFPSISVLEENSFASPEAKRVAAQKDVCTPEALPETSLSKRKTLTPFGSSESSRAETTTDEFLSDYW